MPEFVVIDGDEVQFDELFLPAKVTVRPGTITATGGATVGGKKVCVAGDEQEVVVTDCQYSTPMFPTEGAGTLRIKTLMPDQKSIKTSSAGKPVLLVGKKFVAGFTVTKKAQLIPPAPATPQLDPMGEYVGTGEFKPQNRLLREV